MGEVQTEVIKTGFPILLTVTGQANEPRYFNGPLMLKHYRSDLEMNFSESELILAKKNDRIIKVMSLNDLGLDEKRCGLKGSPTKVHKVKSITLKGRDLKIYDDTRHDIKNMIRHLMSDLVEVNS